MIEWSLNGKFYMTFFERISLLCSIWRERMRGCWTSEVVSVLTSTRQLRAEPLGSCKSAAKSNPFLFPKLWCHYTSPQLAWSYNSRKHGMPSVCIACLFDQSQVGLCERIWGRRREGGERGGGGLHCVSFWNKVLWNSHLLDSKVSDLLHCAWNLRGRGLYIPCVFKMPAD